VSEPHTKTPLYDEHMRLGAKMVPFAGWLMPVQYTSIVEEHQAVRKLSASLIFRIWDSSSWMVAVLAIGSTAC
jgi:glycine cleavage system aminomethyltransferase T